MSLGNKVASSTGFSLSNVTRNVFCSVCTMEKNIFWRRIWTMKQVPLCASSNTSHLEAQAGFFRLFMKGIFNVLWPFDKKLISQLVTHIRTCDYTVDGLSHLYFGSYANHLCYDCFDTLRRYLYLAQAETGMSADKLWHTTALIYVNNAQFMIRPKSFKNLLGRL